MNFISLINMIFFPFFFAFKVWPKKVKKGSS